MEQDQIIEKLRDFNVRRSLLKDKLVPVARAAANQMVDAGMKAGSAPLLEVLFEIDAVEAEVSNLFGEDPKAIVDAIKALLDSR